MPSVSIVVPCRNEAAWITDLLDSIAQQDFSTDEIIVVDDKSDDNTVAIVEEWQRRHSVSKIRILSTEGRGRGAAVAMNVGIQAATSEVIVRLDGHCRPFPHYVRLSVEGLARPRAGVVGGVWVIEPGAPTRVAAAIAHVVRHPIGSGGVAYRRELAEDAPLRAVDTVPFGCFHRRLWEELGGFDEHLLANQDYDFNYRARQAGHDVVLDPRIRSTYRARPTLGDLARQYYRYGFWKLQMLRKFPLALRWRQVPPVLLIPWVLTVLLLFGTEAPLALTLSLPYAAAIVFSALQIAAHGEDLLLAPVAVATILTLHLAWGAGFWHGIFSLASTRRT